MSRSREASPSGGTMRVPMTEVLTSSHSVPTRRTSTHLLDIHSDSPVFGPSDVPDIPVLIKTSLFVESEDTKKSVELPSRWNAFKSKLQSAWNPRTNLRSLFSPTANEQQLQFLDVIRVIAVFWVVIYHAFVYLGDHSGNPNYPYLATAPEMRFAHNGDLGVDMFFVLSGFLIAHMLIREYEKTQTVALVRFYVRRWLRIFPAYGFLLAIMWPVFSIIACEVCLSCNRTGWMNLLFINNLISPIEQCLAWTWSIASEMQFYTFSPFVVLLYLKREKWGIALTAFLLACAVAGRGVMVYVNQLWGPSADTLGVLSMDTKSYFRVSPYLTGMLIAYAYATHRKRIEIGYKSRMPEKLAQILKGCGVVLSLAIMAVVIIFGEGHTKSPGLDGFFYVWLSRAAFGICIAAIIYVVLITEPVKQKPLRVLSRGPLRSSVLMSIDAARQPLVLSDLRVSEYVTADLEKNDTKGQYLPVPKQAFVHTASDNESDLTSSPSMSSLSPLTGKTDDSLGRIIDHSPTPLPLFYRFCGSRVWFIFAQLAYSTFLFHPPFMFLCNMVWSNIQLTFGWVVLIATVDVVAANAIALVVYCLVERPFMNLR